MPKRHRLFAAPALVLWFTMGASIAVAQYVGPGVIPRITVQELQSRGVHDQQGVLTGNLLRPDGGDFYVFDDGTGRLRVEIPKKVFPPALPIAPERVVELTGELAKEGRDLTFEVREMRVQQ